MPSYRLLACALPVALAIVAAIPVADPPYVTDRARAQSPDRVEAEFDTLVRPLINKLCVDCHSTKAKKGSLDLERFRTYADVRRETKVWVHTREMLQAGEMPPKDRPQLTADQQKSLMGWLNRMIDREAIARSGDPGFVPLRRLSHAEYDNTVRDLTGVDLRPASEFPAEGAGGEGFTNAAESLGEVSPALLSKYLAAARKIADHAVLLPDGVRFSAGTSRRDWSDEAIAAIRALYAESVGSDGRLPLKPYLSALIRFRAQILAGSVTADQAAASEKLNPRYLTALCKFLEQGDHGPPIRDIREAWRTATERDLDRLVALIESWQSAVWRQVPVGSYRNDQTIRHQPQDVTIRPTTTVRIPFKPTAGQTEATWSLSSRVINGPAGSDGRLLWIRPRLESPGKPPLLLKDYREWGAPYEFRPADLFATTEQYLAAVRERTLHPQRPLREIADRLKLNEAMLDRWVRIAAPPGRNDDPIARGRVVPAAPLQLLDQKTPPDMPTASIKGWRSKGSELPIVVSNSSNDVQQIPGRISPHGIAVHPTPREFVAAVWTSPIRGDVTVRYRVAHAHPACGNGIAWWLEWRRSEKAVVLDESAVPLGGKSDPPELRIRVDMGDKLILAVDAKNADHVCDLTEVEWSLTETGEKTRAWSLWKDTADNVHDGNPHADRHGNRDVWSFAKGPSRAVTAVPAFNIPAGSVLDRWRKAASAATEPEGAGPKTPPSLSELSAAVGKLLTGPLPGKPGDPDRVLYDSLVRIDGPLLQGLDFSKISPVRGPLRLGPKADLFGSAESADIAAPVGSTLAIKLPAGALVGRELVVDIRSALTNDPRLLSMESTLGSPGSAPISVPLIGDPNGGSAKQLAADLAEFRRVFPRFVCFPRILPDDEVVCLKMYHREDEPLARLFLSESDRGRLDRYWRELQFVSRQAVVENDYLPQFIGYVTQDQPKELLAFYESRRPVFRRRADDQLRDLRSAEPAHVAWLERFAERAYRRPLTTKERESQESMYRKLREQGTEHEVAVRSIIARILVAPAFLFRVEHSPPGQKPGEINDHELAVRLSYFLTGSMPDQRLRELAATGKLTNDEVLEAETRRLLAAPTVRSLAVEFGTQWIHVRGFADFNEKNETLFPTFNRALRSDMNEEAVLFFQDLFQNDRPWRDVLDSDAIFVNERLAKHYGIPGVSGPQFRRVTDAKKHGRGGVLGLGSVLAKQSQSARTSPVLRGNWVVETLLGEKLPRPPANVPRLPETEGSTDGLSTRQLTERHVKDPNCASCHVRIDPFGFALERFDAIGRRRDTERGGSAVDAKAVLRDGSAFEDIAGLRNYLLTHQQEKMRRLFCQRLAGYALGRSTTLSDQRLIDEMAKATADPKRGVSSAVLLIVKSPQFRNIRGADYDE